MANATIAKNEKFNSIEITFAGKPDEETRSALKALRFRWNPKKGVWYGYATEEEAQKAITGATVEEVATKKATKGAKAVKLASIWDRTRIDTIPEHDRRSSTKEVAKATREHFKANFPELKISCRCGCGGWASANEVIFEFVSGCYAKESEVFEAVEEYAKAWVKSFNYDNSDYMTDYFDVNFYESITAYNYTATEPTAEQQADIDNFNTELAKATAEAEQRAEEEYQRYLAEQEAQRKEYEARQAKEEAEKAEMLKNIEVVELAEDEKYIVAGSMVCGHGKECNISEILEDGTEKEESALIKKELHFADMANYEIFGKFLLHDFAFLSGCGGTGTLDERINNDNFYKLNEEQRNNVKWLLWDCVAVYVNNVLMLVIDPEGYSYARYTNIVKDYTKEPLHKAEQEAKETQSEEELYFPAPIAEQAQTIEEGARYTLVIEDPWTLCATMHHITITKATITDYAQYKNSLYIEYIEQGQKKTQARYIHNTSSCLLFSGWLPSVPEEYTRRKIKDNMYEVLNCGSNVKAFMLNIAKYYKTLKQDFIINTLQY